MKGMVFTEFLEMVEERYSPELADQIIEESELPSGGSYTAVGTYDHAEMVQLLVRLSEHTGIEVSELLRSFGRFMFGRFQTLYPQLFLNATGAFDFLTKVDNYIHVEVRKLYPDAELPSIDCEVSDSDCLTMIYRSSRPMSHLAQGLIEGCIEHYGGGVTLEVTDLSDGEGTAARFVLSRPGATGG